jgi:hypothetical protein
VFVRERATDGNSYRPSRWARLARGIVVYDAHHLLPALLVSLALAAVASGAVAPEAQAACTTSVPVTRSFADDPFDGELGLAPEMTKVEARLGTACDLTVAPELGDRSPTAGLITEERVATYLDTDGDPATGAPALGGADRVVLVIGQNGDDLPPALGIWTGTDFDFTDGITLPVVGAAGFTARLGELGIATPTTLGLRIDTSWTGVRDTYDDLAPEAGAPSHRVPMVFR